MITSRLYPVTVRVTEDHLSFSLDPLVQALRDAFPHAADVMVDWMLPTGGQVSVLVLPRFLRGYRTVRVDLPADLCAYMRRFHLQEDVMPAVFTVRVPGAAVRK